MSLTKYTQQLVANNECDDFPISLTASCLAVKYREKFFALCTRHQTKDWDLKNISLISKDGKFSITSGGASYFEGLCENESHDIVALNFTDPCKAKIELQERFFNLSEFPPEVWSNKVLLFVASGYPYCDQNYDLANGRKLDSVRRTVVCDLHPAQQTSDLSLLRLKPHEPLAFDPNGMSGGPAFVVQLVNEEPRAYFAGIITRAGTNDIYIVRSGYIRTFLDHWIDQIMVGENS
jgi:hypothetical protein